MMLLAASRAFTAGLLLSVLANASTAQEYPNKPIRIVVPSAAGSLTDTVPRILLSELTRALGQPVIVENMAGAAGIVGIRYVARQAAPDGYTVLELQTTATIASVFVKDPGFDLQKDFAPVSILVDSPILLTTHYNLPWNTFPQMVAYAKANPGQLNHGLPGPTDLFALYMGALRSKYDLKIVDVAYKNSPAFHQALGVNEVQLAFSAVGNAIPLFRNKKGKPLAVSGDARHPSFPDTPTFTEVRLPEIGGLKFMAFAPVGTPKPVTDKLNAAFVSALQQPEVRTRLLNLDLQIVGSTPEALGLHLRQALDRYHAVGKKLGIRPE